jgi:AcrR family transcriptional regulator
MRSRLVTALGRPREFDADEALDRALALFWRDGYEGASVTELAEAMGVSKPSLYAAFGDKESLYLRALARYGDRQRAECAVVLDAEPDGRKAIEALLLSAVEAHVDPRTPPGCMVVAGTTACASTIVPAAIQRALCEALRARAASIQARLGRARREGQIAAATDIDALAIYLNTVLAGLSVQARGQQCREALRGVVASAMAAWPEPPKRTAPRRGARTAAKRRA